MIEKVEIENSLVFLCDDIAEFMKASQIHMSYRHSERVLIALGAEIHGDIGILERNLDAEYGVFSISPYPQRVKSFIERIGKNYEIVLSRSYRGKVAHVCLPKDVSRTYFERYERTTLANKYGTTMGRNDMFYCFRDVFATAQDAIERVEIYGVKRWSRSVKSAAYEENNRITMAELRADIKKKSEGKKGKRVMLE